MNYRTFREVMDEKLAQSGLGIVSIPFQKWTGWKTPTGPTMLQSFLTIQDNSPAPTSLHLVRAYADDESDTAWREVFPFDQAGPITTLSELVVEIKSHPCVADPEYPLDVTEYDTLMENLN